MGEWGPEMRARIDELNRINQFSSPLTAAVDSVITAQTEPGRGTVRGLPAAVGVERLILSTIDNLTLTTSTGAVPEWLRRPEDWGGVYGQSKLMQWVASSMLWAGCGYLDCTRLGQSWRLDAVHPAWVHPKVSNGPRVGIDYRVGAETRQVVPPRLGEAVQTETYLLPIPYMVTFDHPEGASPFGLARDSLTGFAATEAKSWDVVDDGTYSGGRLETEQDITPATAQRYQDRWHASRHPTSGRPKIPVLGAGLSYVNDLINPRDAQWIEARAFNQAVIYSLIGVPPDYMGASLIGGDSSLGYANAQDNDRRYLRNAVMAFTLPIAHALSRLTPSGRGPDEDVTVEFDYTNWEGDTDAGIGTTESD